MPQLTAIAQDSLRREIDLTTLPDSVWSVGGIEVVGNSHTKDFVILREMTLKPGTPITRAMIEYDQNRIYSLRLFNQVQLHVIPSTTAGLADLLVVVSERWYIFPFPIFGIKDRDWGKVFYGLGILHANFRGRNEKLFASLIAGYDPSVVLSYSNPFISEDGTDFLGVRLAYNKVRNKSLLAQTGLDNFDERHFSTSVTYGKRFSIEHTTWLSLGYEFVKVSPQLIGRAISSDGKDMYPILSIGYAYDTRDLGEYPGDGMLARASITKYGVSTHTMNIVRYDADVRKYIPFASRTTIAGRVFTGLVAAGRTPSYNRMFFGYSERIRGHFKEVVEGEQIFGVSTELHYTLLSPQYFSVGMLPAEFSVWRFGVVAAAFADAGTVWFRGEPFAVDRFLRGYGVGLHFLLPYSFVLRTEFALNEIRHGEFIIDVGAAL